MGDEKCYPVSLNVSIQPEGLKRIVEEGRLMEFIGVFSTLAAEHIKTKVVEEIAKAGVGLVDQGAGVNIAVGFLDDEPYGTRPRGPWPWPRSRFEELTNVLERAGQS